MIYRDARYGNLVDMVIIIPVPEYDTDTFLVLVSIQVEKCVGGLSPGAYSAAALSIASFSSFIRKYF